MNSIEDIFHILRSMKLDIFNDFGIHYLAVLESTISDEPVRSAGIGIAVEFADVSSPRFIELQEFLSNILSRSVHLILLNGMSEEILERMKSDMQII